jgi:hypothetical protein
VLLNVWKGQRTRNEIRADGHLHCGRIRGGEGVTGRSTGVAVFVAMLYEADIFIPRPELSCNWRKEEFMCGIFLHCFFRSGHKSAFSQKWFVMSKGAYVIYLTLTRWDLVFLFMYFSFFFGECKVFFFVSTLPSVYPWTLCVLSETCLDFILALAEF